MQIRTSRADVLWSYAATILASVAGFLLLPFLINYLTSSELGLWYVYLAVGNLVTLFQFGFSPTFARNFAFCWSGAQKLTREGCVHEPGDAEINPVLLAHLIAACRRVYRRVALIALLVLSVPGTAYIFFVASDVDVFSIALSWAIFSAGVLFNLYFLWYESALSGIGAIAARSQSIVIGRLVQVFTSASLLFLGVGIIGPAVGFLLNAVVYRIVGNRYFWGNSEVESLKLKEVPIDKVEVKRLFKIVSYNAFQDGGVQLANYASTQASSLICSLFLGLEQSGAFSIALQFATAIGNFGRSYMNSFAPMLQSAFQRDDHSLIRCTLGRCAAVYVLVSFLGFLGVLVFVYPILGIFKPDSNFVPLVFCGVMAYMFLFNWCALFANMLANMNTIPYAKAYIVTAVAGVALSIVLINISSLGVWGLILGLALPQCAYNVWHWPNVTAKKLGVTPLELLAMGMQACSRKIWIRFSKIGRNG